MASTAIEGNGDKLPIYQRALLGDLRDASSRLDALTASRPTGLSGLWAPITGVSAAHNAEVRQTEAAVAAASEAADRARIRRAAAGLFLRQRSGEGSDEDQRAS